MKFIKNPGMWFAAVLLFTLIISPAYSAIVDKAEKSVVEMDGFEKTIFVDREKSIVRYEVLGGGRKLHEKDGQVMSLTTIMPVRRPTMFITTRASANEEKIYRQFFTKKT